MTMKRKITAEEFAKLSKELQKEYTKEGEDYLLDAEGYDDADELRRAHTREKQNVKDTKKLLKEANEKLAELEAAGDPESRTAKDAKKIDAAWKEKHETAVSEFTGKLAKSDEYIKRTLINSAAERMASAISTSPSLISPAIKSRLTVVFDGEAEPVLKVLNADGKAGSMTLDQLQKELLQNKEYSPILIASKASGGGAPRNGPEALPASSAPVSANTPPLLSKLSGKELAEHVKSVRATQGAET